MGICYLFVCGYSNYRIFSEASQYVLAINSELKNERRKELDL